MSERAFFDSNVLLYLITTDPRADVAESLLRDGGVISVQVLNEFTHVARRKFGMKVPEIREVLRRISTICEVVPVTQATHLQALSLAERYGWSIHDACIVSSALEAECVRLYSEDLQDGQRVSNRLRIKNPFA